MAASDGATRDAADHLACGDFMRRVAGGKASGHGKAHDVVAQIQKLRLKPGDVERGGFGSGMSVATIQKDHRIALQRLGQPAALHVASVKADEDQGDAPALAFDQCIGGERRGQRHQRHIACGNPGPFESGIHRAANAQRKVLARGQRLGLADDGIRRLIDNHGIRIGAAGINTEKIGHGRETPVARRLS